jgi:N-acetylneuraminic acid mutarotase
MKSRYLRGLAALAATAIVFSGGTALAAKGAGPQTVQKNITFKSGAPLPFDGATRFDGAYVASSGRVYFLGYRQADNFTNGEVWYYDVATKTYVDTGTAMTVAISNYSIAQLTDNTGDGLYVFGGRTDDNGGTLTNATQVYYPATNTTKVLTKDKWPGKTPSSCVSLPAMGVATVGGKAYVMGGAAFSANGCIADENSAQTWVFDPLAAAGSRWTKGPKLNMARGYITTAVLGGKIYAIGGDVNDAGALTAQTIVESLKPGGSWNNGAVADLPEACDESQAFAFAKGPLASTITLAGCGQWPNALPDVLQYDAVGDSWSTVGSLLEARRNQAGASIGTNKKPKLFVVGGYDSTGGVTLATSEVGTVAAGPYVPRAPLAIRGSANRVTLS